MSNVLSVRVIDRPCILLPCIALVLLFQHVVGEKGAVYQLDGIVNRRDLIGDNLVHFPIKFTLEQSQLLLLVVLLQTFLELTVHFQIINYKK